MFLTKKEVAELTGAGFRHLQIESLVANGIRHTIRRDGWPAVPRSAVIGGKPDAKEKTEAGGWQPRKAS